MRADKQREAGDGFDRSWVAHPGLVASARDAFDKVLGDRPHQLGRQRPEVRVRAADLLTAPPAQLAVTMQGLLTNISVALQYLAAWVDGSGAVAIENLMEDAATVEISRAQVWQWIHNGVTLAEGPTVTRGLVQRLIAEELARLGRDVDNRVRPHLAAAADIFAYAALGDTMPGFFTQYGYVKYVLDTGMRMTGAGFQAQRAATPEQARQANAELRSRMRSQNNYFSDIETVADGLLKATKYSAGPISRTGVDKIAAHLGCELVHVGDLPSSVRTVTDLVHHRVFLPHPQIGQHDSRTQALQALGHVVLGHQVPADYGEFLTQRVEINYFAAALLIPQRTAVPLLATAKAAKDIAIEDLRDAYAVSYETAAHRFTKLATEHLGLPVHFMRISSSGVIYKAYQNDGVHFPTDAVGAIEGQRVCKHWTAPVVFDQADVSAPYRQYTDTGSAPIGAPQWWTAPSPATSRSASACPTPTPNGCAAGKRPSGPSHAAPTPAAAPDPRPNSPSGGATRSGPAPRSTPTCSPPCRPGCSPESTTPRC